jgi:shikimate dehydrogenase
MPHKRRAAELAEELTPVARLAGSVNSLKGVAGRVWGHSTDAIAFQRILGSARFPPDAPVLILGAGGTAAAALAVTERRVTLSARRAETAVELAARFPNAEPRLAEFGSVIPGAVVVNATPLGMRGEDLPAGILESASGLIDLAYGPGETPAVDLARHRGLSFVDGYEFLALQAAESFRWWTGKVVDVAVMISAARNL